jgi:hypothetical protein
MRASNPAEIALEMLDQVGLVVVPMMPSVMVRPSKPCTTAGVTTGLVDGTTTRCQTYRLALIRVHMTVSPPLVRRCTPT